MSAKVVDINKWGRLTGEQQAELNDMYRRSAALARDVAAKFNSATEAGKTIYVTDAYMADLAEDVRQFAGALTAAVRDRLKTEILECMKECAEAQHELLTAIARNNGIDVRPRRP